MTAVRQCPKAQAERDSASFRVNMIHFLFHTQTEGSYRVHRHVWISSMMINIPAITVGADGPLSWISGSYYGENVY